MVGVGKQKRRKYRRKKKTPNHTTIDVIVSYLPAGFSSLSSVSRFFVSYSLSPVNKSKPVVCPATSSSYSLLLFCSDCDSIQGRHINIPLCITIIILSPRVAARRHPNKRQLRTTPGVYVATRGKFPRTSVSEWRSRCVSIAFEFSQFFSHPRKTKANFERSRKVASTSTIRHLMRYTRSA